MLDLYKRIFFFAKLNARKLTDSTITHYIFMGYVISMVQVLNDRPVLIMTASFSFTHTFSEERCRGNLWCSELRY